jgi:hypothetical protein
MSKWRVYGIVTGSKYLGEFEAKTKEEAEQLAIDSELASVTMCYQCAEECEDPEIHEVNVEAAD